MALACPTNQLQWQRFNAILAAGFFCPLMQTPFALPSMFLGCRFCKHSTLVNWTYQMFNKPSLTVKISCRKKLQDVTYSIQTWAPRTTVSKLLSFVFVPHHLLFFFSLFFNLSVTIHLNSQHGTPQAHLPYARTNQFIHWLNFNSEKPVTIYYIFCLFKKTRLTSQCKYAMLIMQFARQLSHKIL